MPSVASVLADFGTLSPRDQAMVISRLLAAPIAGTGSIKTFVTDIRFSDGRFCPVCGSMHVVRNGKRKDGTQKYRCADCGKYFISTTNSITVGTHKSLRIWEKFIDCMMDCRTLRDTARICGIHYNTAFRWRHKVLDALQQMAAGVELEGIVEADETFFDVSYKGNHTRSRTFIMPRAPHKHGKSSNKRGLSYDKVCVPCAVNRTGLSIAKVANLAKATKKGIKAVLNGRIKQGSTLVTDKESSYVSLASADKLGHIRLKSNLDSRSGIYHIQHVNNYHSRLKRFIRNFNGVSTKYLNNYLIWHNFVNYAPEDYQEKRRILLGFALTVQYNERNVDIPVRKNLPLLA